MAKSFKIIFIGIIFFLCVPIFTSAVSLGQKDNFFVDQNYDWFSREEISATLKRIDRNCYFYIDNQWWETLETEKEKEEILQSINSLGKEFHNKIYPSLTTHFGSEWKPGIDEDIRITILIHPMIEGVQGYFNSGDEYPVLQVPNSNQREMVYLNSRHIIEPLAKSYLAHEFTHLITFNQKDKIQGNTEEVWLNEARAEYAPTLCGYDDEYEGSNLQKRVKTFLQYPSDSITEWQNKKADYGALNLFTQYLVEHYGIEILINSLKSNEIGIKSLNEALKNQGCEENFSQIFTDWTIAVLVNNCELKEKYCYQNENLKNLRVVPYINFLPINGKSNLGVSQTTKNWTGNWYKFIGGKGDLNIKFIGNPENLFIVPYIVQDISWNYSLDFFELDEYQRGEIFISNFNKEVKSITIIPSIQSKKSKFSDNEPSFSFFWEASTVSEKEKEKEPVSKFLEKPISEMTKDEVLSKITEIEAVLSQLKAQLEKFFSSEEIEQKKDTEIVSCQKFENNLYYGMENDDIKCLQIVLNSSIETKLAETGVGSPGLETNYFGSLTKAAVIKFQEKYASEILTPWNLNKGTGFVGKTTREKLNKLLSNI